MTTYGKISAGGLGQGQQLRHWNHPIAHGDGQIGIVFALVWHAGRAIGRDHHRLSDCTSQQCGAQNPEEYQRRVSHCFRPAGRDVPGLHQ